MGERTGRRQFLAAAITGSLLAGCLERGGGVGAGGERDATTTTRRSSTGTTAATTRADATGETDTTATTGSDEATTETTDATTTPKTADGLHEQQYATDLKHPVAEKLGHEPTLGAYPDETDRIVLMFDDPSCSVCARFEREQMDALVERVVDPGKATFVSRNFPHTHEWSHPATHALESTYARDEETYWDLRSYYFLEQERMTTDNVLDNTAAFLADTPVDGDGVVADVEDRAYETAVELDLRLKRNAGIFATPVFFLFRDGEFLTRLVGNQSVRTLESALGL